MKNYIMFTTKDGVPVKLELTPEQVALLAAASAEPEHEDMFGRKIGSDYYCVTDRGEVVGKTDVGDRRDNGHHNTANYCRDKNKMVQRALHETLDRLLWRYSEQHGGDTEWDGTNRHWYIYKAAGCGTWNVLWNSTTHGPCQYFCSTCHTDGVR